MASTPDVRVRLSAEGQAEVIAAFQKIASEGKKSGAEAGAAFKELNNQLKDVGKTLVGGLGMVLIAEEFKEFFKSTLEGVETMTRLSKQTGLSTNLIQGFGRAARETGVDQETANNALAKFTVNVGKAGIGSKASRDALTDLGISIKDFSKLAPDAQFQLVAQKLAAIPDPARRARDEVALFSRAGVQLDQALQAVGREGLDPFIQHMKDLGVFLDTETIGSIKGAAESFKNLGDTVKGLATQFLTGLVPGLQAAADELLRATTGPGVNGFKEVGKIIGEVFATAVNWLEHAGNGLAAWAAKAVIQFQSLGDQVKNIFNPTEVVRLVKDMDAQLKAVDDARAERNQEADNRLNDKSTASTIGFSDDSSGGKGGEGAAGANAAALAKARLGLLEAGLDNELKLYQAHAALIKEADKQAYDQGTLSLTDYFARRAAAINQEADKELTLLKAKRSAVASSAIDTNDPVAQINQKKELAALDNQIAIEQVKQAGELAANVSAQAAAQRKLYEDQVKNEEKLLELAGKKTEAARVKLALDLADLDAELRKAGTPDDQRAAAVGTAATQGNAQIDFGAASAKATADLATLTSKEKELQVQVQSGQLFSIDAAQKTVAAQREMLPVLEQDAQAMLALAQATGNAEDVQKAQAYVDKIRQIKAGTDDLGKSTAALRQGAEDALGNGINRFLTDAVSGTKTLKESFIDMGRSMLQTLEQVIIKQLELKAIQAVFSSFSGGGPVTAPAPGHAGGGQIKGLGTSTSDSIPARLSDGEFVVNAKSVSQPGVLPLLTALNQGALKGVHGPTAVPKFAAGGAVSGSARQNVKFVNVLDPSLLGDHLATAAGEQSVLNVISRNPNKVSSSLR
jgi:hypothetical protein